MIDRKIVEVLAILTQAGNIIDSSIQNAHLREYLRVFAFILQVSAFLSFARAHNQTFFD